MPAGKYMQFVRGSKDEARTIAEAVRGDDFFCLIKDI
jgi:hypothetical protein